MDVLSSTGSVDPHLLTTFVVVAEELDLERACQRLELEPREVEARLTRLEGELGAALVAWTADTLSLTPSGEALLDGARPALVQLQAAVAQARVVATGTGGMLRIGTMGSFLGTVVPEIVATLAATRADLTLQATELQLDAQLRALHDGLIDLTLLHRSPDHNDLPIEANRVEVEAIARGPRYLALPSAHALAASGGPIRLELMADEGLVLPNGDYSSGQYADTIAVCQRHGFVPRVVAQAPTVSMLVGLVAEGFGSALVPWPATLEPRPGVVFVPIADAFTEVSVAYCTGPDADVRDLIAAVRTAVLALVPEAG